jgi:uncharacterized membrane protein HdeD (DUF308 family)
MSGGSEQSEMLFVRAGLGLAMIAVGGFLLFRLLHYPLAESFSGLLVGAAMIALGVFRLRQVLQMRGGP